MTKSILCVLFTLICYTHGFITESGLVFEDAQCAEDLQLYWNDLKSLQKWTLPCKYIFIRSVSYSCFAVESFSPFFK